MSKDKSGFVDVKATLGENIAEDVLDAIRDGVTVVDRDYRLVYLNQAILDFFGIKNKKELLGKTCYRVFFSKDAPCEWCKCEACFESGQPQYTRGSLPGASGDAMFFDIYTYPYFDGDTVTCVIEVAKDVTDRAKLESQIQKLATIVDTSADAMMSVDLDASVEFWNRGAETLFGYKKDEILGQHFHKLVPKELQEEAEEKRKEALKKGFVRYETFRLRKDGTHIPVDMTLTVIKDDEGKPTGIAGSIKDLSERKKLEEDYKSLFENAKDGISITDKKGNLVLFNSRFVEMTGYTEKELKDMHISLLVHPGDLAKVLEYDRKRLAGEEVPKVYEFRLLRKDGSVIEVEATASPVRSNGEIVGTQGILRDLSEREKLESEIRETKRHLESVLDTIQEAICVIDRDLRIISFNETFAENTSTPKDKILGKKCYEVLHNYSDEEFRDICAARCIVLEAFQTGSPAESVHGHEFSGEVIYHESRALPTKNHRGEAYQVVYVINDITERKRAEKALSESEEKYRNVVESSPDMIFLVDRETGRIVDVNSAACRLLGRSKEEIAGTISGSRVVPKQREAYRKKFERLQKTGEYKGEFDIQKKDGSTATVEVRGAAIGKYLLTIGRDVTERKAAEERLSEYASDLERSNKLKDLFADILRHDLLNPIGVIRAVFELMEENMKGDGAEEELSILYRNLEKIEEIINTATRFGMVESAEKLEFESRNLREIIEEVVETFKGPAADRNMKILIPEGDYVAEVNVFIEDVFSNLLSNAIKYSPPDTDVEIWIEDEENHWKVMVADKGPGVPDKYKRDIFERFKRVEKGSVKGTGLGLAIVKKVVELHNGDVWVEDNPGGGSVFVFALTKKRSKHV